MSNEPQLIRNVRTCPLCGSTNTLSVSDNMAWITCYDCECQSENGTKVVLSEDLPLEDRVEAVEHQVDQITEKLNELLIVLNKLR